MLAWFSEMRLCCNHVGPPSEKKQRLEDGPRKDEDEMEKADDNHEWFSGEHCTICSLVTHRAGILAQPKK